MTFTKNTVQLRVNVTHSYGTKLNFDLNDDQFIDVNYKKKNRVLLSCISDTINLQKLSSI